MSEGTFCRVEVHIIVDDPTDAAEQLNIDLETINRWTETWFNLVKFNPSKSESLLVSRKINRNVHPL